MAGYTVPLLDIRLLAFSFLVGATPVNLLWKELR